jgi:hypothetical protein
MNHLYPKTTRLAALVPVMSSNKRQTRDQKTEMQELKTERRLSVFSFRISVLGFLVSILPLGAQSAPWTGILDPSRAIDWSQAGIPGGIPSRTSICANVSTTDTTAQIQAKINACPQDGVVKFPAGTWTISGLYSNKGVVLRGAGPTKTVLNLNNGNIFLGIAGTSGQGGYPNGPYQAVNWTGGLNQGDTVLTVASTSGMKVGQTLILDQHNNTNLVFPTGNEGTQGAGRNENPPGFDSPPTTREQFQMAEITAVNDGTHITVNPPVDYTHDPSLAPQVFWWNPNGSPYPGNMRYAGVEDMHVNANHNDRAIIFTYCSNCWVRNVEVDNIARGAITTFFSFRNEIRDSYISAAGAIAGPTQYGFEIIESPYTKLENNIMFNVTAPVMPMTDDGLVVGYNYAQHIYGPDNQFAAFEPHQAHSYGHLYEGNVAYMVGVDNVWGSASQLTFFRNRISGLAPNKTNFRVPLMIGAHQRYLNFVGNILGTVGYHTRYQTDDTNQNGSDDFIYDVGFWNRWDFAQTPYDSVTKTSLMRWGNWDSVTYAANGNTNGVRWCTGTGAGNPACAGSETASTEPFFAGLASPSQTLPASFYLPAKPVWFGSAPWPPIGPDVACAANCNANTANHAAKIPAQLCYENGPKDASGYLTAFDATVCYGASAPPPLSACDLNNDSATNVSDVQLCANQAIGAVPCTTGDINKDNACNVVDVQRVVNNALGGQCVTN